MTAPSRRAMQRSVALGMTRRLIGVAVRNVRHDGAALRWALFEAAPHADAVQVIHAYAVPDEPLLSAAQAVARDVGYLAGWEVVAAAVEQGSRVRPDVAIIGSPVGGPTEEVLTEISSDLDLLVLGDDEPDTPQRRIAAHLQRSARCPVVCVPHGTETFSALPVTVVADDLGLSPATLEFAAEFAGRHGVTLQVARTWRSLHRGQPTPDAVALAEAQVELDAELLELRRAYPELPVVSRIELDGTWLERVREHSGLVVAGRLAAPRLGLVSPLPAPLCPVAFVPETLTRGPSPAGLREPLGQKS